FGNSMMTLEQVQEWIEGFLDQRNLAEDKDRVQITLAFYSIIYNSYIKRTFPVSFLHLCAHSKLLHFLHPLEQKHPGLLLVLGKLIAENQLPIDTQVPADLAKKANECTETGLAYIVINTLTKIIGNSTNTEAQQILLEAYKALFLQAFQEK